MREVGVAEELLRAVERRSGGQPVSVIRLRIGVLHGISASSLRAAFSVVASGTVADHAEIEVELSPVRAWCRNCGNAVSGATICDFCGSSDIRVDGGDEIVVESVTVLDHEV